MNRTFTVVVCFSTALLGCDSATKKRDNPPNQIREITSNGTELPEPWFILQYSLGDYVKMQPDRGIIVSFGAYWGTLSESNWRVLFSDEVSAKLRSSGFLCLVSDLGDKDNLIAKTEMAALNRVAVPVSAIYDPVDKIWHVMPEFLSAADASKSIIDIQNKIAEQAGSSNGG